MKSGKKPMTIKQFLKLYQKAMREVTCLEFEITELRERLTSVPTGFGDGMPRSPNREDSKTKLHAIMADKVREKEKKKADAEDIMASVLVVIDSIKDPVYRQLLFEKYIQDKTWTVISQDLRYASEEYVRGKLHGKALNEARKFYCNND